MNLKYKILSHNPTDNTIVVRYYTPILTEAVLASEVDAQGKVLRARSDFNIMLPNPIPTGIDLQQLISDYAPIEWFGLMEDSIQGKADMSSIVPLIGVETVGLPKKALTAGQQIITPTVIVGV